MNKRLDYTCTVIHVSLHFFARKKHPTFQVMEPGWFVSHTILTFHKDLTSLRHLLLCLTSHNQSLLCLYPLITQSLSLKSPLNRPVPACWTPWNRPPLRHPLLLHPLLLIPFPSSSRCTVVFTLNIIESSKTKDLLKLRKGITKVHKQFRREKLLLLKLESK